MRAERPGFPTMHEVSDAMKQAQQRRRREGESMTLEEQRELLEAARQVIHARGVTEHWGPTARTVALTKLETAVANATGEDGTA